MLSFCRGLSVPACSGSAVVLAFSSSYGSKLDKSRLLQAIKRTKKDEYIERELKPKTMDIGDSPDCVTQYFVIPDDCLVTKSVKEDVNKRFIILILNFSFNI